MRGFQGVPVCFRGLFGAFRGHFKRLRGVLSEGSDARGSHRASVGSRTFKERFRGVLRGSEGSRMFQVSFQGHIKGLQDVLEWFQRRLRGFLERPDDSGELGAIKCETH